MSTLLESLFKPLAVGLKTAHYDEASVTKPTGPAYCFLHLSSSTSTPPLVPSAPSTPTPQFTLPSRKTTSSPSTGSMTPGDGFFSS